jgi:hypothetical protein
MFRAFLLAAALLAGAGAAAQQPQYDSAFAGYRSYREEPVADWRAVNEEVARVGGHVGVLGGASGQGGHAGAKAPSAAPQSGPPPQRSAPKAPAAPSQHEHHEGAR